MRERELILMWRALNPGSESGKQVEAFMELGASVPDQTVESR